MAAQVVQDEKGNIFLATGGGVFHPLTEDQAKVLHENPGTLENMGESALQGLENLYTGAGMLLSDDPKWQQQNREGRARSEALSIAEPGLSTLARFGPQVAGGIATGIATGGASIPVQIGAQMGVEGLLGALSTPETPWEGAAWGAGTAGVLAGVAPGARALAQSMPDVSVPGWLRNNRALDAAARNPGGLRPGDLQSVTMPESSMLPRAGNLADDMSAAPSAARPGAAAGRDAVGDLPLSPSANPPSVQQAVDDATARVQQAAQAGDAQALRDALIEQQRAQQASLRAQSTPRMGERVAGVIEDAAEPRGRVLEGMMTPEELTDYGVPTSPAQQAMLRARTGGIEYEDALEALRREEGRMTTPVYGQNLQLTRALQKRSATNFVATELGLPVGANITDDTLSSTFRRLGAGFDQMAENMGGVQIDDGIRAQLNEVLENVTGDHAGQLQKYVREIEAKAAHNGGELSGKDWGTMRTKLLGVIDAGQSGGNIEKISDASRLMNVFTEALEAKLPEVERLQLAKMRKQYAIAMNLTKAGARTTDGVVNPSAFYRNWKRPQSKKMMAKDDVGRFMNTLSSLTTNVEPNSGTAWRLGMRGAQGVGLAAAGSVLGPAVGSWLFGGH